VPCGDGLDFGDIANDLKMHSDLSHRRETAPRCEPVVGAPGPGRRRSAGAPPGSRAG
jgi:hypothetical protein